MAIKAQPAATQAGSGGHAHPGSPDRTVSPDVQALSPEDALVMVIFPKVSWDAVVTLAQEMNVGPAEALGAALALLRARVDEEAGRVR